MNKQESGLVRFTSAVVVVLFVLSAGLLAASAETHPPIVPAHDGAGAMHSSRTLSSPPASAIASVGLAATSIVTVTVGAGGIRFSPADVEISVGGTVRWVWEASGHTVTSGVPGAPDGLFCSPDDQDCSANPTSSAGSVYEHTFSVAGVYPYFCRPHGFFGMTGSVTVSDTLLATSVVFMPIALR